MTTDYQPLSAEHIAIASRGYLAPMFLDDVKASASEREIVKTKLRAMDVRNQETWAAMQPIVRAFDKIAVACAPRVSHFASNSMRDKKKYDAARMELFCQVTVPTNWEREYDTRCAASDKYIADKAAKEASDIAKVQASRQAARDAENARRLPLALVYLVARGYRVTADGIVADHDAEVTPIAEAPAKADSIAYAAETDLDGGYVAFGDDDCTGCKGWDGASPRCDCGRRRVYWKTEGGFEAPIVYAQAD